MPLRLIFCGTSAFGLPTLRRLVAERQFEVSGVITQPDRPRGRELEVASPPVKRFALEQGLYVFQPERIASESARGFLERLEPDAVVIIAYGQIVPKALLGMPRLGWINLHASLLPKYRGAAPVNWAIVNGEQSTGITTMLVEPALDTGPILIQQKVEIGREETAPQLAQRMAEMGAPLVMNSVLGLDAGSIVPLPQNHAEATHAPLLKKDDGRIDWAQPAVEIYNRIRGFDPWPGVFSYFRGQLCHLWGQVRGKPSGTDATLKSPSPGAIVEKGNSLYVACGHATWLELSEVQLEGRKRVSAAEFARGARIAAGEAFSLRG
jgi:methionyl-tRNA formyltransferase